MSRKWHKGPPPHIGWWEADSEQIKGVWRWWNGCIWSWSVHDGATAWEVADLAKIAAFPAQHTIEWTHYYPKNARVPRIDPRKVKT